MSYASVSPAATVNVWLVSVHVAAEVVAPLSMVIAQDMAVLVPLCRTVNVTVLLPE
jgi:hypothetical protein